MRIYINETEIDFSLDMESTLFEVMASLDIWMQQQGLIMLSLSMDSVDLHPRDFADLQERAVDSATELRIISMPVDQIQDEQISAVLGYTHRLLNSLRKAPEELARVESLEGCLWLCESSGLLLRLHVFSIVELKEVFEQMHRDRLLLEERLHAAISNAAAGADVQLEVSLLDLLMRYASEVRALLSEVVRKIARPVSAASLDELLELHKAVESRVPLVSEMLQTGKEHEALSIVEQTAHMLDLFFYVVRRLGEESIIEAEVMEAGGSSLKQWIDALLPVAREIVGALENNDTVLLGDLFEYELQERLSVMKLFLELLHDAVSNLTQASH